MPVGGHHVLTFFRVPRLVSLATGKIVHEWTDLDAGEDLSSIVHHHRQSPPLALDPTHARFALAGKEGIDVVRIDVDALARS
jgi:hypothetical protein